MRQSLSSLKGLKQRGCDCYMIFPTDNKTMSNTLGPYMTQPAQSGANFIFAAKFSEIMEEYCHSWTSKSK